MIHYAPESEMTTSVSDKISFVNPNYENYSLLIHDLAGRTVKSINALILSIYMH